jgi:mRNA-degrading endonuclease YafQ of YafQ-DinJ toxin-antitoxin module
MKEIRYSPQFTRYYKRRIARDEGLKREYQESVEAFLVARTLVNDHALENVMQGKRAFSINNDYRVIYLERDEYYLFVDVGTEEAVPGCVIA